MDTDSLYQQRVKLLYRQPNTVRGRCIVWYAQSASRPIKRVVLAILLTLFVGTHMVLFAIMILQVSPCITQKLSGHNLAQEYLRNHVATDLTGFLRYRTAAHSSLCDASGHPG